MATQAVQPNEIYNRLDTTVQSWENRLRWKRFLLWLPFSLIPGLTIGVILAVLSRMQPLLTATQILNIAVVLTIAGVVALMVGVRYWQRSSIRSARYFDLEFGLKERVSTALEIIDGRIRTVDDIRERQLVDAINIATTIQARDAIELVIVRRHWVAPILTLIVLLFLLILPNPQENAIANNPQQQTAIDNAAEQVRDITEMVASDTALSDEQRDSLIETLETNLETLRDEDISTDEAFASTSQVQSALEEQSAELNAQADEQEQGLEQGNQALEENAPPPPPESSEPQGAGQAEGENPDEQTTGDEFNESINQISENLDNMSQAEREQAADAIQRAADAARETNPDVADALDRAAEAVRNQNSDSAREALNDAQQAVSEAQEQINQTRESAQSMQDAADAAQQSANEIANAAQPQNEQGDQQSQQSSSSPPDDTQSQEGGDPQTGNQTSESETSTEANSGQQQADTQRGVESVDTRQTAGDTASGDRPDGIGQSEQDLSQQNNPDGQGVNPFESIYAPQRLGGEADGPDILLDPDVGDETLREIDVTDDPSGESVVPYSQVFADYSEAASRELDNDYVPLGLRDVIRDYFTSLDPEQ